MQCNRIRMRNLLCRFSCYKIKLTGVEISTLFFILAVFIVSIFWIRSAVSMRRIDGDHQVTHMDWSKQWRPAGGRHAESRSGPQNPPWHPRKVQLLLAPFPEERSARNWRHVHMSRGEIAFPEAHQVLVVWWSCPPGPACPGGYFQSSGHPNWLVAW